MEDQKFALLIDSDNVSHKYIGCILDEMSRYGVTTYKRIYGDWTSAQTARWREELLENSIIPIQQFQNTVGKNSTDSALIIDAMDILYTRSVDGFCIVSSDSDFTRLASRLRESGMTVIGMGEEKTPRAFRAACSIFTSLEMLYSAQEEAPATVKKTARGSADRQNEKETLISREAVESAVINIITENENRGRVTALGEVGSRLQNKYPDFDVRNYGYSLLSKFLAELPGLALVKDGHSVQVRLRSDDCTGAEAVEWIVQQVKAAGTGGLPLSDLGNQVHSRYPDFHVRDFGYSQFSKFLQSIDGITVDKAHGRVKADK